MAERDYPEGHPASADYKGQKYAPPRAPWTDDFAADHPARGGKNLKANDSPDGLRAEYLEREQKQQSSEAPAEPAPEQSQEG